MELVDLTRTQFLYDTLPPYKWSDTYLAQLLSQAEREACKRASLILDKTIQTSGNIASGIATSTTANKLVDTNATFTTAMVGLTVYNSTDNTWASITARDSGTTLSLSANIMTSGESYVIGDASKALTKICITSGVSEYVLSDKVIKVERCCLSSRGKGYPLTQKLQINSTLTGTPTWYTEEKKLITLFPTPDASINSGTGIDTLNLEVYRLPLIDLSSVTDNTPEIDEEYHFPLIFFVCAKALLKGDMDSIDTVSAQGYEAQFANVFGLPVSEDFATKLRKLPSDFCLETKSFGL